MVDINTRIDEVEFGSERLKNILYKNKIFTLGTLASLSDEELLMLPRFGRTYLFSVKKTLDEIGFRNSFIDADTVRSQTARTSITSAMRPT